MTAPVRTIRVRRLAHSMGLPLPAYATAGAVSSASATAMFNAMKAAGLFAGFVGT